MSKDRHCSVRPYASNGTLLVMIRTIKDKNARYESYSSSFYRASKNTQITFEVSSPVDALGVFVKQNP
jgi:hypothetical protein